MFIRAALIGFFASMPTAVLAEPSIAELQQQVQDLQKENLKLKAEILKRENQTLKDKLQNDFVSAQSSATDSKKEVFTTNQKTKLDSIKKINNEILESPITNWNGYFIGSSIGIGYNNYALKSEKYGYSASFLGGKGEVASLLFGYDHLFNNKYLIGAELGINLDNINSKALELAGHQNNYSASINQGNIYSISARIGYLLSPNSIIFTRVGLDNSDFKYSGYSQYYNTNYNVIKSSTGILFGIGVENKINDKWSSRLEYDETFYSSHQLNDTSISVSNINGFEHFNLTDAGLIRSSVTSGIGKISFIYNFGDRKQIVKTDDSQYANWQGSYIGGTVGGLFAYGNMKLPQYNNAYLDGASTTMPIPAAYVGYNWQLSKSWVLGLETEVDPGINNGDLKVSPTLSIRGKGGYLFNYRNLIYTTLGYSNTNVQDQTSFKTTSSYSLNIPPQHVNALQLGVGTETKITNNWIAKFDYQYVTSLGNNSATANLSSTIISRIGSSYSSVPFLIHPEWQLGRIGLSYMF